MFSRASNQTNGNKKNLDQKLPCAGVSEQASSAKPAVRRLSSKPTGKAVISRCHSCQNEANNGGNPEDIYPEPYTHQGFPTTKPNIRVPRVEYPSPTAYESYSQVENLAGTADELPSYEETMTQQPPPPSHDLTRLRYAYDPDGTLIADIAYNRAVTRHRNLMFVAKAYRRHIRQFQNKDLEFDDIQKFDYCTEVIETFLFDQEQIISRINLLQGHLEVVDAEIASLPNPSKMAFLEHQRQGIIRELEGHADQQNQLETADDWNLRLYSLLCDYIGYDIPGFESLGLEETCRSISDRIYAPSGDV